MEKAKTKAEIRDKKHKPKMRVSGKSVFKIQEIIVKKAKLIAGDHSKSHR